MSIKVSVITVCLNCKNDIGATMESIFQQSHDNIECIVIDGDSTDGTLEYLQSNRDKLDVLISEPDRGIYDAMNKGIAAATGDYLIFVNAGDRLRSPDAVEKVITDSYVVENRPKIISGKVQFEHKGELLNLFRPVKAGKEGPGLPHQATFIDVTLQKANPFDPRYRFVGDYELWRRLKAQGDFNVYYIDEVISIFSLDGVSNNIKNDMKRYLERTYVDYLYSNHFGLREYVALITKPVLRRMFFNVAGSKRFFKLLRLRKKFRLLER